VASANNELERIWEETAVAYFRYFPRIFLEVLKKTMENLSQGSRSTGRDLKPGSPENEARVLPTRRDVRFEMVSNRPSRNLSNLRMSRSQGSVIDRYIRQHLKFHKSSENMLEKNDCIEVVHVIALN
jgi:hypothetical protein